MTSKDYVCKQLKKTVMFLDGGSIKENETRVSDVQRRLLL